MKARTIVLFFIAGLLSSCAAPKTRFDSELDEFTRVLDLTLKNYVEPVTRESLIESAIAGVYKEAGEVPMVSSAHPPGSGGALADALSEVARRHPDIGSERLLHAATRHMARVDRQSRLVPREEVPNGKKHAGCGVEVRREGTRTVIRPLPGTPAAGGDVRNGDRLVTVDGVAVDGQSLEEVVKLLKGELGSTAELGILRSNDKPVTLRIQRQVLTVAYTGCPAVRDGIGYVHLPSFYQNTDKELRAALAQMEEGGPLRGLVLDLRDNSGGVLGSAVTTAGLFMRDGLIARVVGRGEGEMVFKSYADYVRYPDLPLIVLVNERTASGAELVAAALQDHRRARVAGARTAGIAEVKTLYNLNDRELLQLTTARLVRPSGRSLGEGVVPDVVLTGGSVPPRNAWHPCGAGWETPGGDGAVQVAVKLLATE